MAIYESLLKSKHCLPILSTRGCWRGVAHRSHPADTPAPVVTYRQKILFIYSLKVDFTTVIYTMKQFPAIAFVMPEKPSKQMFDDIGFIIVSSDVPLGQWKTIKLFTGSPRTDEYFQWFRRYSNDNRTKVDGSNYYVVGYAMDKVYNYLQIGNVSDRYTPFK